MLSFYILDITFYWKFISIFLILFACSMINTFCSFSPESVIPKKGFSICNSKVIKLLFYYLLDFHRSWLLMAVAKVSPLVTPSEFWGSMHLLYAIIIAFLGLVSNNFFSFLALTHCHNLNWIMKRKKAYMVGQHAHHPESLPYGFRDILGSQKHKLIMEHSVLWHSMHTHRHTHTV